MTIVESMRALTSSLDTAKILDLIPFPLLMVGSFFLLSQLPGCTPQALGDRCDEDLHCERDLECRDRRCQPPATPDPFTAVEIDETIEVSDLDGPVDVILDGWGTPHIYASSRSDAWAALGYIMARDRFAQLELARRVTMGTLAATVGDRQPSAAMSDMWALMLGLRDTAEASWTLVAEDDVDGITLIAFSRGVSAFLARAESGDEEVPESHRVLLDDLDTEWTPVDSLALARLEYLRRTWNADRELELHILLQQSLEMFSSDAGDLDMEWRNGFAEDVLRFDPARPTEFIHGPPVALETALPPGSLVRPALPSMRAQRWLGALRTLSDLAPRARGSLGWVAPGSLSQSGGGLLAATLGGPLVAPPPHYVAHINVTSPEVNLEVAGLLQAGVPAVVAGFNRELAWFSTPSNADLMDLYYEEIQEHDDGRFTVSRGDEELELEIREIDMQTAEGDDRMLTASIPGHGPLIPALYEEGFSQGWDMIGLSVRWYGNTPSRDLAATSSIISARSVDEAARALEMWPSADLTYLVTDNSGGAASVLPSCLPTRDPRALRRHWNRSDRSPPCMVSSGTWTMEWSECSSEGQLASTYSIDFDPMVLLNAGADPTGATRENEPFFDGSPYLGWSFEPGFRTERLSLFLATEDRRSRISFDEAVSSLADGASPLLAELRTPLVTAMERALREQENTSTERDLTHIVNQLGDEGLSRLESAVTLLDGWDLTFPASHSEDDEGAMSAAAAIAGAWLQHLIMITLADELDFLGTDLSDDMMIHALLYLLSNERGLRTFNPSLGHSTLFDDLSTSSRFESRDERLLRSLDHALDWLEGQAGSEMADWRWGAVHTVTYTGLPLDEEEGDIGNADAPLALAGGPLSIRGCDPLLRSNDLSCSDGGPVAKLVVELTPWGPFAEVVVAGGQSGDPEQDAYRGEIDTWLAGGTRTLLFETDEVLAAAEHRMRLLPADADNN